MRAVPRGTITAVLTPDQIRRAATVIASARAALGVSILVAPRMTRRIAGIDAELTPAGRIVLGLFGVREVVLGLSVLERTRAGYPSGALLRLNALCDAGDLVVLLGFVKRRQSAGRLLIGVPTAAGIAATWLYLARQLDEA